VLPMRRKSVSEGALTRFGSRMHALRFRSNQDESKWIKALHEHAQILVAPKARQAPLPASCWNSICVGNEMRS